MLTTPAKVKHAWSLVKDSVLAWLDDYAPSMGAALAYYTVFSVGPVLIIVIAVAGLVFGDEAAQGEVVAQLRQVLGEEGALAVQAVLKSVSEPAHGIIATVVSIATLLIGATTVLAELQSALDRIWRVPTDKGSSGVWTFIRVRLWAFGMVLGLGFLLLVSLVASAALAALGKWWAGWFGGWHSLLQIVNFGVSFAIITGAFAMIYKFLPRVGVAWRDVWIGAAVTALLFTIGKYLIGLYLGRSSVASGFGAAGSLVVLLIWVYYSAQIFLLGAEFTWIYAHRHGSRVGKPNSAPPDALPSRSGNTVTDPNASARLVAPPAFPDNFWLSRTDRRAEHYDPVTRAIKYIRQNPLKVWGIAISIGVICGGILRRIDSPSKFVLQRRPEDSE